MSDLVTMEQVAELTGRSKCGVRKWRSRYPDFPPPYCPSWFTRDQPFFNWTEVRLWLVLRGWWDPVAEVPEPVQLGRPSRTRELVGGGQVIAHVACELAGCVEPAAIHMRGPGLRRFACFEHFSELIVHPAVVVYTRHYLCPDCGLPGSVWDPASNTCNVPDSVCEGLAAALEWMSVRDEHKRRT